MRDIQHELDKAIMVAIVGDNPVSYSESGKQRADTLKEAINSLVRECIGETDPIDMFEIPSGKTHINIAAPRNQLRQQFLNRWMGKE